jgi:hypothetical protein
MSLFRLQMIFRFSANDCARMAGLEHSLGQLGGMPGTQGARSCADAGVIVKVFPGRTPDAQALFVLPWLIAARRRSHTTSRHCGRVPAAVASAWAGCVAYFCRLSVGRRRRQNNQRLGVVVALGLVPQPIYRLLAPSLERGHAGRRSRQDSTFSPDQPTGSNSGSSLISTISPPFRRENGRSWRIGKRRAKDCSQSDAYSARM